MKAITILLTITALSAHAQEQTVYERIANKPSAINHGLEVANGKQIPVIISIFGSDSIEAARRYGRYLAGTHLPIPEAVKLVRAHAQKLYPGQPQMIDFFQRDCSASYDETIRERGQK